MALHGVRKSLVRRIGSDSGFTLVETMVALGILFVGLLTLAYTATIAFSDVGFARQRQGATAIANRILEEVRGLPYAAVSLGLDIDDLNGTIANGTETDVVKTDAPLTYTFRGEEIPFGDLPPIQPTNPHIASGATDPTLKLGSTVYTQKVYVTYGTGPAEGGFHVTVIVSWANPQRGGVAASVEAQTHLYASPPTSQDCSSSETHPFSAPCQPFFYGTGNVDPGIVTTTGTVEDLSFDSFQLDLIRANADAQLELVSQLQGGFRLPAGNKTVSGATTTAGGQSAISAVDNDPASPTGTYQVQPSPPSFQPAGSVSVADDGNELRISLAGSDSGSTTSAMAAGGSSPCTIQTDGRPCGYTSATQLGAVDEVLNLAEGVGSSTLVRVGAHAAPSTAYVRRVASGGGDGVLRETVVRNLPDVQLGAIPSSITPPVGWLGYWVRVTGYSAMAQAEAGTNSTAPIQTISGGQVQYWNGVGYTPVGITTAGSTLAIPAFTYAKTNGSGDQITVQLTASLKIDASPATTQEFLPGSSTTRTSARAMLGSPLTGTMTVRIQRNGSEEASVTLAVKLGTVTAQASYKPAPTPS